MFRRTLFTAALAAALLGGPAAAANWVEVGKNVYGSTYELDHDSFAREGQQVTIQLRVRYGKPSTEGLREDGYIAKRRLYCAESAYQDLHTDYYRDGQVVGTAGVEDRLTIKPESIVESLAKVACAR